MAKFDPDLFMQQTIDQPMETERTLVPAGEYQMNIDDFDSKVFQTFDFEYKQGPNAGQPGSFTKFNCPCVINDDKVKALFKRDKVLAFKPITLDFNPDGSLAFGVNQNVELGQLRQAVGQNAPGTPWLPAHLRGAGPFMGRVEHKDVTRKDGSKVTVAEVTRVARIS